MQRSSLVVAAGALLFALPLPGTFVTGAALLVVGLVMRLR